MTTGRWGGRASEYAGTRDAPSPPFGLDAREYKRDQGGRFSSGGSGGGSGAKKAGGKKSAAGSKSKKASEPKAPGTGTKRQSKPNGGSSSKAAKSEPAHKEIEFTTPGWKGGRGGNTRAKAEFEKGSPIRERKAGEEVHWRKIGPGEDPEGHQSDPYCPTCGRKTGPDRPWTTKRRPEHTFTSEWVKDGAADCDICPDCKQPLAPARDRRPVILKGRHGGRGTERAGARDCPMATDPPVSEKQRKAMWAAAKGNSTLGIPQSVGKEFAGADPGGKLPARAKK